MGERKRAPIQCYHPKYAVVTGKLPNGKDNIRFIDKKRFEYIESGADSFYKPDDLRKIPCGSCVGCRLKYSMVWANRLLCELVTHDPDKCFFVTLTYAPEYIDRCHKAKGVDDLWSLEKKDLQDFMKRLRRKLNMKWCTEDGEIIKPEEWNGKDSLILYQRGKRKGTPKEFYITSENIRFYAAGEYGEQNHRCHFHLILFNANLPKSDLRPVSKSKLGYQYFSSSILEEVWPYGYNVVAPVTWETCCYTARYMMKKLKGFDSHVYSDFDIEAPFAVCSRKPGIGKPYFDSLEDFAERSNIVIGTANGSRQFAPPPYFEKLFEQIDPEKAIERANKRRQVAIEREKIILSKTDLDREKYLQNLEDELTKTTDMLLYYRSI